MIGILVDITRCTGCNECIQACVQENHLGADTPHKQDRPDGLSANRYAAIVHSPEGRHVRKFCRHCLDPACVSVCPVGAMIKTEHGPVIYDASKCMGCRYCMMACPYGIPRYEWESATPLVKKCTFCYSRLQQGEIPACVEACPEEALIFGTRDELLDLAHARLEQASSHYLPVVYGEQEAGGTSVLYISDVPLDFLAYHQPPSETPLPDLSWSWLGKVPSITMATAGLMTGLFWVIGRRMQAQEYRLSNLNKNHDK
jgi:formate dehydrogenase iron-sulfur subunit